MKKTIIIACITLLSILLTACNKGANQSFENGPSSESLEESVIDEKVLTNLDVLSEIERAY
jgi:hypothetical protein